jgi:hypothetical protein
MKNGFISAPVGAVIVWYKSATCPAGFVKVSEIADGRYLRYNSSVNLSPTIPVHNHTNPSHGHGTRADGGYPTSGGPTNDPGLANDYHEGTGLSTSVTGHTHSVTLEFTYFAWGNASVPIIGISGVEVPYTNAIVCRRM